jgi:hypothetical protein
MALTRDLIERMLVEFRRTAPSLEWQIREAKPGPDEYDIDISLPGARDTLIWLLEGNDSARVLVDSYTFDHIEERHLQAFLSAVLDIGPADEGERSADERRGQLIVRNAEREWRS